MTTTLNSDDSLHFRLDSIRKTLNGSDKASTLDLKNFNLTDLTATLFSDSDITLEPNTLESRKGFSTDTFPGSDSDSGTAASLSGVEVMMDSSFSNRKQTYDVIDMSHDVIDDLDEYLNAECDSQYSTLDLHSSLSLAGSSQYSTLDTASSPHQRIVSQPCPTVNSLSQVVFEIPDEYKADLMDSSLGRAIRDPYSCFNKNDTPRPLSLIHI